MTDKPTVDSLPLTNVTFIKPNYKFTFHNGNKVVGTFDFNGPKMVFSGDADESVAVFVKTLSHWFEGRLQQEREAERRECAIACEGVEQATESQSWVVTNCVEAILDRGRK